MAIRLSDLVVAQQLFSQDVEGGTITQQNVSPGAIGLIIFVSLGLGTFFLWRSMNKQLKRIDFDEGVQPDNAVDVRDSTRAAATAVSDESADEANSAMPEDHEGR